jgi:histone-lysine N-methyltransferase SETMAR
MVTEELSRLKSERVPHPPYSPDLSPWDSCLFGMLKDKIKDRLFRTIEEIITAVHRVWSEVTLDDLQSIFFNWMERFEYVINHEWEYYTD